MAAGEGVFSFRIVSLGTSALLTGIGAACMLFPAPLSKMFFQGGPASGLTLDVIRAMGGTSILAAGLLCATSGTKDDKTKKIVSQNMTLGLVLHSCLMGSMLLGNRGPNERWNTTPIVTIIVRNLFLGGIWGYLAFAH